MFRLIKITFKALILVLALAGFNAIGGQKYIEAIVSNIDSFINAHNMSTIEKIGNFSNINEEFEIDRSVNLMGYKAVIAEHKASNQKLVILDTGKKTLLSSDDIQGNGIEEKLQNLSEKFKYQGIRVQNINVVSRGKINIYDQEVPYAKFEAKVSKLPVSDISGMIASVKTSDGSEKLALSLNERKKYSQLITSEFYKEVKEK